MSDDLDATSARHGHARTLAEQALAAQEAGDDDEADRLFAEAARIDPDAVANALGDASDTAVGADSMPQDDAEIEAMSRTVQPGSDAPSRAGVGGRGSGADNQD